MNEDHRFIELERIVKNGFIGFGRNIWLAIAAIAMMAITLTILLFALVANATFRHQIDDLTSHIDISVFLKDGITDKQKSTFISQIKKIDEVKTVDYISKEQSLKIYEQQNANNKDLLTAVSEINNPLPAKIVIHPKDPYKMQAIRDFVAKPQNKSLQTGTDNDTNKIRQDAISNITHATHFFEQAGIVGIIVFILISMLIIFNTIRMAIFNRRDELVIMRLLGASTTFIRGPFIVETMLYGAVAAGLSLIVCGALFGIASSTLQASSLGLLDISYSSHYFSSHLWLILTGQIAAGIIIGAASSALATRRYLRLNK